MRVRTFQAEPMHQKVRFFGPKLESYQGQREYATTVRKRLVRFTDETRTLSLHNPTAYHEA